VKILVRGTNWIGDAVMTIPAIRELRRLFPASHITVHTREGAADIFRTSGLVDEVVIARSFLKDVRTLRARVFDVAVIFPNSFESALAIRLAGVKRRLGYNTQHRSFLLTDAVDVPVWKESRHEAYYYFELVGTLARTLSRVKAADMPSEPEIIVSSEMRENARIILKGKGIDFGKSIVALAPGSTHSRAKRWTPESFARINDRLREELNVDVVLMGSPGDKEVSNRVSDLADRKPIDLTGETDLALAAAVLNEVDLLISNDMGLAHLAPAVGTETIVIFGPTNPITTRPFSAKASIITANVECSPCMLRDCPIDHRCMTRVSADEVFEHARMALRK
jgi:heptosyltransferase II